MQENEQKIPIDRFEVTCEIVFLTILAIVVYVGGILFLGKPISRYMPVWFLNPLCFFSILALDAIWIMGMKFWRTKNVTIKIIKKILSTLVLSLSASVLTSWLIIRFLRAILC
jgi:branched-subunit amino acid transport protein